MKIYSLLLILLIFPTFLLAGEMPVYQKNVEKWENSMLDYVEDWRNFVGKPREDIESIRVELEKIIASNSTRPKLKIIMGGLYSVEAGIIVSELKQKGIALDKIRKDANYVNVIKKLNENYKAALELDHGSLLLDDFRLINGVITSADIRVSSLRKMIELWNDGKRFEDLGNDPVIDFDYKSYFKIVTAYVDEKRYDEALSVINEIEEKFPSMKSEINSGRHRIIGFLQKEKTEEPKQEKTTEPVPPEKPDAVVTAPRQPPVVKADEPLQKEEVLPETNNNQAIIVGAAIAILILIGFVVARRRK